MSVSVLLTGGSGRLGGALISECPSIFAPTSKEMDITDSNAVLDMIILSKPDVIIHSAAVVGRKECDVDSERAEKVNILGTRNIVSACKKLNVKLIFISTAAIFDGRKGNYTISDTPNPQYLYSETKLLGEKLVNELDDHLIVRTDFFDPAKYKYNEVFSDHYCSKEPTPVVAKKILKAVNEGRKGILHIGGSRNSLYEILKPYFPEIKPIMICESSMPDFPRDLSLYSGG